MTPSEQVLLSLIRQSLFGTEEAYPADVNWDAVLQEAKQQTVVGIVAKALPESCAGETRAKWTAAEYQLVANHVRYWKAQDELHQLLTENGIPYVILKGAAAAMYYPGPMRRAMGDIDFLVPTDRYEEAKALLFENGYQLHHQDDDRHIGFNKGHVFYELHHRFSYEDLDLEEPLLAAMPRAIEKDLEGHRFFTLPTAENGLVLLAHLWGHLHTGVGLRQAIDWMLFVHAELSDEAWETSFSQLSQQYGLQRLAKVAAHMCQKYFGLPDPCTWCADADEALCDELFSQIQCFGNFGRKARKLSATESKAQTALSQMLRYGFIRYLQKGGELQWKACHRHPWLKPFAWVYQLFRYPILWLTSPRQHSISSIMKKEKRLNDLLRG